MVARRTLPDCAAVASWRVPLPSGWTTPVITSVLARLFAGLLAVALCGGEARAQCQIRSTELPVTMVSMQPVVTARINGSEAKFIIDSGAFYSLITPAAAEQFKLNPHRAPEWLRVEGIGGRAEAHVVRVERFELKNTVFPNVEFIVSGSEPGANAIGLLGQNFLGTDDVEYDLAHGVIRLIHPLSGCEHAQMAYWARSEPVVEIDLRTRRGNYAVDTSSSALINGVKVRVKFDTGATASLLSLDTAKEAGLKPGGEGVVPAGSMRGIGRGEIPTWIGRFKEFNLGGESIKNTRLRFGDMGLDDTDMLIGSDFFLSHHIYVANSQGKLYFTYNGGPAFDLSIPGAPLQAHADNTQATSPASDELAQPTDAGGYARRAAAYVARQDYPHALDDYSRACELDPKVGAYFLQRGQVRLQLRQQFLAMGDFNDAIRLDPNDVDARIARARLHLAGNDKAAARADLDAANAVAAGQANLRLELGHLYMRLDQPEAAIAQYDLWIAAHQQDSQLEAALNNRCWARALLGIELDKALDDCDAALDTKRGFAAALDSRGLVHLRRGELDRALKDYDEALRIRPKTAWALYGRGIVHLRQGDKDAGNADIAAAKALRPAIDADAQRYGIGP
jgi:tetratricopeptide (TPR) repeat protein/predicted aspartyl protease